eukprot:724291-Pleurochrysis_carterae.AAC.2
MRILRSDSHRSSMRTLALMHVLQKCSDPCTRCDLKQRIVPCRSFVLVDAVFRTAQGSSQLAIDDSVRTLQLTHTEARSHFDISLTFLIVSAVSVCVVR